MLEEGPVKPRQSKKLRSRLVYGVAAQDALGDPDAGAEPALAGEEPGGDARGHLGGAGVGA